VMSQAAVGERVRRLRVAVGLGQVELAQALGLASGAVSMLENGRMPLEESLVDALAKTFDCSPAYFTHQGGEPLVTRPWLRAYADASKKEVDRTVADTMIAIDAAGLAQLQVIPDTLPLFSGDLNDDDDIEAFADEVRAGAGLSSGDVVGNSIRTAERLGVVVLPMNDELGRHLGLSLRVDGTPIIRVSRPSADPERSIPGDRQRFTVAHELGHLGLHHNCPPPDSAEDAARIEKQAHRFAAAFLAPGDALLEDLNRLGNRVTLTTLSKIKETWGIAIKALVVRFQHLGVVSDDQARSLYKQISARRWNKHEPVPVGNESAVWFASALEKRATRANTTVEVVAASTGLGISHFTRWTDWSPTTITGRSAEVVNLPRRGTQGQPPLATGVASVTHLTGNRRTH
jgi:Zn-dependent peptidase ImmA (M78 family)/transcriptional regulator with XRE-family HTH domain